MQKTFSFGYILLFLLMIGCSHVPFMGKKSPADIREEKTLEENAFVEQGRIVNAQALKGGKNIAIVPFTAGVGVEATDGLDRIALMIVKGVSDAFSDGLNQGENRFSILTAENLETADFIIQGHVSDLDKPSKIDRWVLFNGQKSLGVDGKMVDTKTGEAVLIFNDAQKTNDKTESYNQLGYRIGKNIGLFILSGSK